MKTEGQSNFHSPGKAFGGRLVEFSHPTTHKAAKRTRGERERDIAEIASMYVKGMHQGLIVEYLNANRPYKLSRSMISYDIQVIRTRWLQSALQDFNEAKSKELAKLDELERSYWDAWEASKKSKEVNVVETISDTQGEKKTNMYSRTKGKREVESRDGNPVFLLGVERCIEKRCNILGLFAARRVDINWREEAKAAGADPDEVLNSLVNEFVEAASRNAPEGETQGDGKG